MSKFTTEVRYICETYASATAENADSMTIDETITAAAPHIFDDNWTTYDPEYKPALEKKILRHYYTQEIGMETVALWQLHLNNLLSEIMPKYNVFYANVNSLKEKLLQGVDVTEVQDLTNNQKTTSQSASNSETNDEAHSAGHSETTSDTTGHNTNSATSNNDAWQEYSDTPQGTVSNLENRTYLTNATHNRATNTSNSTTDSTATSKNVGDTTNSSTDHATGFSNTDAKGTADTTENYVKHIFGKNNGTSYIDEYLKLVAGYNDIDAQIIKELQPLFMGLWE